MSKSALLKSSLAKKYWMSLTGLFLCTFLIGHLIGNLQLFIPGEEGREAFNTYAKFMTSNPAVKLLSYLTYISILFHAIDGIMLVAQNRKARPVKYAYNNPGANSTWNSRSMGILGTIILVFIVTHMMNFWAKMHFSEMPTQIVNGEELKDLYTIVFEFFRDPATGLIATLLYAVAMLALAFHLLHGFRSAFQSLGVANEKLMGIVKPIGIGFAIIVPLLFALIPLYIHFS